MEIRILLRDLTPFEHLVAAHLCDGLSNVAIARATAHSEKVIENTVSRMARAFGITSDGDTNIRVLLALAYRTHFGDASFDKLNVDCSHSKVGEDGKRYCDKHVD
ncbi:MAG: chemotaxis protein CheY [Actinomycetes bacterium]|jgi:DNA-binding NarL/FixJ family response regulator